MLPLVPTPLVRLGNLFPGRAVDAKCEFLAPSGCFKIRGATHLLEHLARDGKKPYATAPKASRNQWLSVKPATQIGTGLAPGSACSTHEATASQSGVSIVERVPPCASRASSS